MKHTMWPKVKRHAAVFDEYSSMCDEPGVARCDKLPTDGTFRRSRLSFSYMSDFIGAYGFHETGRYPLAERCECVPKRVACSHVPAALRVMPIVRDAERNSEYVAALSSLFNSCESGP